MLVVPVARHLLVVFAELGISLILASARGTILCDHIGYTYRNDERRLYHPDVCFHTLT